jgi:F-type H+-transporting ATPase subunit b
MNDILNDPIVWYALAVIIVVGGIVWKGRAPIYAMLDAEIAKVRAELDQAHRLRATAEATLIDYEKRQEKAMHEAEAILAQAQADAERMRAEAEAELEKRLRIHEEQAIERIRLAEIAAVADVRSKVIEQSMHQVRALLSEKIDAQVESQLLSDAIASLDGLVAAKVA